MSVVVSIGAETFLGVAGRRRGRLSLGSVPILKRHPGAEAVTEGGAADFLGNSLRSVRVLPILLGERLHRRGTFFRSAEKCRHGRQKEPGVVPGSPRASRFQAVVAGVWRGNMPKFGNVQLGSPLLTDDIIAPWKESWWKLAEGGWLPPGGCHARWLLKYFSAG